MMIATVSTIISLIFLIAFVAAMIILQVYLSRRERYSCSVITHPPFWLKIGQLVVCTAATRSSRLPEPSVRHR